jgi:hippurate hydrolase
MTRRLTPALLVLCAITTAASAADPSGGDPRAFVTAQLPELVAFYKQLHTHPELSFMEEKTSATLVDQLRKAGAEVTEHVGGYGIVGVLRNGDGPRLLIRSDMDALPVTEATGLPYASKVRVKTKDGVETGVMHACGHDIHMTCLVGVARFLASHKDQWHGTVILVGQPAEERLGGAAQMLKAGLYEKFGKPDAALALHVDFGTPAGKVRYRAGFALANSDAADITLIGRGGHGAQPQSTVDPVVMAAQLVLELQTIVSREIAPTEPAVITVGSLHAGTKHNIIPDHADLQLTIRSYSDEVRKHLWSAIERKAKAVALAANAPEPVVKISEGTGAVFNNEDLTARVAATLRKALGDDNVLPAPPTMGAEDFGLFRRDGVPICMFSIGSVKAERLASMKDIPSLHSPLYWPDPEPTITTGVTAMSSAALNLLKK